MFAFGIICLYLLAGGIIWWYFIDKDEMKKDVPYGEVPAIVPLRAFRISLCVHGMFLGVPTLFVFGSLLAGRIALTEILAGIYIAKWWFVKRRLQRLVRRLKREDPEGFKAIEGELLDIFDIKEKQDDGDSGIGDSTH